jgi:ADP-ribosylglycohydrolase
MDASRHHGAVLRDKRLGALYGAAVGDALGVTHEFEPAKAIPPERLAIVGGGVFDFAPGEVSDDTDLLLAVLGAYPERNNFDPNSAVQRMLGWLDGGPPDVGIQTRAALDQWRAGREPELNENAQGNGGLMRAAAHSLACDSAQMAAANASQDTKLTHPSDAAVRCSAQFAALLLGLLFGATPVPESLHGNILAYSSPVQSQSGHCVHSLRLALWALAEAPTFEQGLDAVIKSGGDTDTNGAIAGALLGARFGYGGIPTDWLSGLDDKVCERLEHHALRLAF